MKISKVTDQRMHNPYGFTYPASVGSVSHKSLIGPALVLFCTCFNLVLCFINTQHWLAPGATEVAAISLALLAAAMLAVRKEVDVTVFRSATLVVFTVTGLKFINPALDLKILFDLAIAPVFYLLGRQSTVRTAERMLAILMLLIIIIGLVELYLKDFFQYYLDVLSFYTSKGVISADSVNYNGTQFFTSSQRSEDTGRTLLPQLFDNHRVSSIFLEPISMGNFSLLCMAWLISVPQKLALIRVFLIFGAALCVILPDSRQAAATCVIMVIVRMLSWRQTRLFAALLPLAVLLMLVFAGMISYQPFESIAIHTDDFRGRLVFSAELLSSFDLAEWLALSTTSIYTADTGYAYLINSVGLPVALLLGASLAASGRNDGSPGTMRGLLTVYVATSLCVGASFFSIKTAALLWFLFGVTQTIQPVLDRPQA